ncbi:protein SUPPRESSOR OF QUENCHING 1, chloroplastic-like isoform X2 [Magnolia sinica]|uniref:protein SUPPRESSOR OF QUENCHING 1, chloroplastic-like isoform X2 n=1 Tax=Magnolia sinica TaxID=86752 RepID=UPI002658DF1D|nr:protein SUPPRESSOR OF QUENCHING 1, chloroplastic-like isoform X2 [Magnolia sinica]
MQYASPKGVLNMLLGVNQPNLDQKKGESRSSRIQQFVKYISDVEASGTTPTVPEFPSKLDWLNTAPLQWHRGGSRTRKFPLLKCNEVCKPVLEGVTGIRGSP